MENKKKNTELVVTIIILVICLLGLSGYMVYDKFLVKEQTNEIPKELNNQKNQNDNRDNSIEYTESFLSDEYINEVLYSLKQDSKNFDEDTIVNSLYHIMTTFNFNDKYDSINKKFKKFYVSNFDLSPYLVSKTTNAENVKTSHNYVINYISKDNLNELVKNLFNYDFYSIKEKMIKHLKNDSRLDVFGEYNNGYLFAFMSGGSFGRTNKFISVKYVNDLKVYNYDIYCSLYNQELSEFEDRKIGEVEVTSKYNKDLKSFVFTEYEYELDKSIDLNNCYSP